VEPLVLDRQVAIRSLHQAISELRFVIEMLGKKGDLKPHQSFNYYIVQARDILRQLQENLTNINFRALSRVVDLIISTEFTATS